MLNNLFRKRNREAQEIGVCADCGKVGEVTLSGRIWKRWLCKLCRQRNGG